MEMKPISDPTFGICHIKPTDFDKYKAQLNGYVMWRDYNKDYVVVKQVVPSKDIEKLLNSIKIN